MCDKLYFKKFIYTCNQLVKNGKYNGTICLVIGDDLLNDKMLDCDIIKNNNIIIKHFPNIQFPKEFLEINNNIISDGRNLTKKFQWHKLNFFNTYFKQWRYVFYLDCGMTIFSDISPILNEITEHKIVAHSDAYPTYERRLHGQFCKRNTECFTKLNNTYNLNVDYFQTGIMLYDTEIITENTYDDLLNLTYEYPISIANEQAIIALYFTNVRPLFKQIKTRDETTYYYDALSRNPNNKYIMLKSLVLPTFKRRQMKTTWNRRMAPMSSFFM
jgi:hypothetical protein